MFNNFFSENHAIYEMMRDSIVEPERTQIKIIHGIPKATNTHSECVILIYFPRLTQH